MEVSCCEYSNHIYRRWGKPLKSCRLRTRLGEDTMNEDVPAVINRIHYLIMTDPKDLKLSLAEQQIIFAREANGGSWDRTVAEIEASRNHPRRCLAGWMRGYEGRHNVNLANLFYATRTN